MQDEHADLRLMHSYEFKDGKLHGATINVIHPSQTERELAAIREERNALAREAETLRREMVLATEELAAAREARDRYERAIRELAKPDRATVLGITLGDWEEYVQQTCVDLLNGIDASCANCGTEPHDGPCVGEGDDDGDYESEPGLMSFLPANPDKVYVP